MDRLMRPRIHTDIGGAGKVEVTHRPSPEMLAEALRRNCAPRSLTHLRTDGRSGARSIGARQEAGTAVMNTQAIKIAGALVGALIFVGLVYWIGGDLVRFTGPVGATGY